MTRPDTAAIEARLAAATPGPWEATQGASGGWGIELPYLATIADLDIDNPKAADDAALIAHAPTDLRALLDEAERLRATIAAVEALAEEWSTATCQTDGAPCSWHRVSAECAAELRDALDGDR